MNLFIFLERSFNLTILIVLLAIVGLVVLFNFIRDLTSEPLENEELKKEYLEKRFEDKLYPLEEDEFDVSLRVDRPYTKKKEWYVWKIADRGYQGLGSTKAEEKYYELFKIFDYELDDVIKTKAAKEILKKK